MKKFMLLSLCMLLVLPLLTACREDKMPQRDEEKRITVNGEASHVAQDFTFDVNPTTFEVTIEKGGVKERASEPLPEMKVANLERGEDYISWTYPKVNMEVFIQKQDKSLAVELTSTGAKSFQWPIVRADSYMLPLWEGKYIPSDDPNWKAFLEDEDMVFSESFSMRFFALNKKAYTITYLVDNMFNNTVQFDTKNNIQMGFTHEFPSTNKKKSYSFRLFVTDTDPVQVASLYKDHVVKQGEFKTLQEKAKDNPNIRKLYGAPHIYFWESKAITDENIHWNQLRPMLNAKLIAWVTEQLKAHTEDGSTEWQTVIKQVQGQDDVDNYQKRVIVRGLNEALKLESFYNPSVFTSVSKEAQAYLDQGIDHLSEQQLYALNKQLMKDELKDAVDGIDEWGKKNSSNVLDQLHEAGIKQAWIGLPNWANGLMNPDMVNKADQLGYLIGPYDSYHSIHEVPNRDWNTASFKDASLYEKATVTGKNGEKVKGFLGRGRKLNPTLAMPSVKQRFDDILKEGIPYRTWFIDCDATGEFYDDYTPLHITSQEQDMKARLERLDYVAKDKHMVVGSEGGNDYASPVIAFAHGIETPVIKWSDPDMRKNKESSYYVGGYWSPDGSVPDRYSKQVPIKELYQHIYVDPAYSLPLFKLVYNDSVITTHHWEWGSLKIQNEVANRMLVEFLYNVPPLYHLDSKEWEKQRELITSQVKAWSPFHEKAVQRPMTDFKVLSEDRLVQATTFGSDLKVIANFSDHDFAYEGATIKAHSALIMDRDKKIEVTPKVK
ncbi:glycoside hydrolase [Paenibacillus sp. 1001270B_150601_E10]|uniref:glycoside hydrolase n=1 Tax=Paenibacillus sp. 1001270B_150601_E10 TaxID=2787079 RepID=UPI00189C9FF6|nr:glycoside hydrolase [Paenibacillus sp. 1001270B_150601_E10]